MQRVRRNVSIFFDSHRRPVAERNGTEIAAAGGANRATLLLSAIDPVRKLVVGDDVIELRGWLVVPGTPCLAAVHSDGRALVHRQRDDVGILRIDPDRVIVVAAGRALDRSEILACISGFVRRSIRGIDRVFILWIHAHHREIVTAAPDSLFRVHQLPALAGIIGAIHAAVLLRIHHGVHAIGIAQRNRQANAPQSIRFAGQTFRDLLPVVAPVG